MAEFQTDDAGTAFILQKPVNAADKTVEHPDDHRIKSSIQIYIKQLYTTYNSL